MTLAGYFGSRTGRPYFDARLILPRLNVTSDITFLMDTGSDGVVLHPDDSRHLLLDYSDLIPSPDLSLGVGGLVADYTENALLVFTDATNQYVYEMPISIAPNSTHMREMPSLLGRQVLDDWHITYRASRNLLIADVDYASFTVPLPGNFLPIRRNASRD